MAVPDLTYYFHLFFDYVWTRIVEFYDYMKQQGFFVDRGDPVNDDFVVGDFVKDNNWHELDLSAIVPEHAHGVLFQFVYRNTLVDKGVSFRTKGNVNVRNLSTQRALVANIRHQGDFACPCDPTDRKLEYRVDPNTDFLNFTVKGWWF